MCAHHDGGHAETLVPHPPDELHAVHAGHLEVHKDAVERLLPEDPLGREGVLGTDAVYALDLHIPYHQVPDVGLIVDNKNSHANTSSADARQIHFGDRSASVTVVQFQGTALGLDELLGNRKPYAAAVYLGREERIEQLLP